MIIISLTPSEKEIISGIPQTIELSTNIPSTIYYTLDGTIPTPLSDVYTEPVYLPTHSGAVTVSVVAYYYDGYSIVPSAILTQIYATDSTDLGRTRYVFFEGIVYSYPGGADIPLYYDFDGNPVFYIDIPLSDLEMIVSETNSSGDIIGTDNQVTILSPEYTGSTIDDEPPIFSSANNQDEFRPDARYILIDGRASAANRPSVDILNGHLMSLRNSRRSWSGIDYINLGKTNYFSGSSTRYHFDRDKNVIVFSYFDSNSGCWVKSIQDLPPAPTDLPRAHFGKPHVFKWFQYGRYQS
jgi:hypothetical protein